MWKQTKNAAIVEKERATEQQTYDGLIAILQRHVSETGESEGAIEVLERIIKERDIARYDLAKSGSQSERYTQMRRLLTAAILSQPDKQLRIKQRASDSVMPSDELVSVFDPSTMEYIFRVIEKS